MPEIPRDPEADARAHTARSICETIDELSGVRQVGDGKDPSTGEVERAEKQVHEALDYMTKATKNPPDHGISG